MLQCACSRIPTITRWFDVDEILGPSVGERSAGRIPLHGMICIVRLKGRLLGFRTETSVARRARSWGWGRPGGTSRARR